MRQSAVFFLCMCASWCDAQQRTPFIINGTPSNAFPAVGIVGELSVGGFCTGTLIGPSHVLTAAHCGEAILAFGSSDSGTFTVGGRTYFTADVRIMPTYNSRIFTDDLAILVLSEPVEGIVPMEISDVPPPESAEVTLVGFGGQGTPSAGSDGSFGEKLVGMTMIDSVSEFEISWTFDEETESNPAPGDSGGPVLLDVGDGYVVVGVVSSGTTQNAGLGDTTFSMRVDAYLEFIIAAVEVPVDDPTMPSDSDDSGEVTSDPGQDDLTSPGSDAEEPVTEPGEAEGDDDPEDGDIEPDVTSGDGEEDDSAAVESPSPATPVDPEAENDQQQSEEIETPDDDDNAETACLRPAQHGGRGNKPENLRPYHDHRHFHSHRGGPGRRPSASQRATSRKYMQSRKASERSTQFKKYQSRKTSVRRLN